MECLLLLEAGDVRGDEVEVPDEVPVLAVGGPSRVREDPLDRGRNLLDVALGEPRRLLELASQLSDSLSELVEIVRGREVPGAHRRANVRRAMNLLPGLPGRRLAGSGSGDPYGTPEAAPAKW